METGSLRSLLRAEMTAVNQQFIHILALRRLGRTEHADRIYDVDLVDFPNVMQIIDYLAAAGEPVSLPIELPRPGRPMVGLIQAEIRIEDRLQRILTGSHAESAEARRLIATAAAPRAAYRDWLNEALGRNGGEPGERVDPSIDHLFSCSIVIIEHMMVRRRNRSCKTFPCGYQATSEHSTRGSQAIRIRRSSRALLRSRTFPLLIESSSGNLHDCCHPASSPVGGQTGAVNQRRGL